MEHHLKGHLDTPFLRGQASPTGHLSVSQAGDWSPREPEERSSKQEAAAELWGRNQSKESNSRSLETNGQTNHKGERDP